VAAFSSAVAFTAGSILPIVAILMLPTGARIPVTFAVVLLALALTGALSVYLDGGGQCSPQWLPRRHSREAKVPGYLT
jgi:vacuolar iron transporter family protein